MTVTSIWDGIEDAEIYERGRFMQPGFVGVICIKKTLTKMTRKSGMAFIVEFEIVESNMPDPKTGHPVGSKATWFQKLQDKSVAFPAIKEWVAACTGYHRHQKEEIERDVEPHLRSLVEEATNNPDDNPFIGVLLKLETIATVTKNERDFTRYNFEPMDDQ